jgi:hypothetical protein
MEASDLVLHVSGKNINSRSPRRFDHFNPCHDMGSAGGVGLVCDPLSLILGSKLAAA